AQRRTSQVETRSTPATLKLISPHRAVGRCPRAGNRERMDDLMPARQPFTLLCQQLARGPHAGRADLHLHTPPSTRTYTPPPPLLPPAPPRGPPAPALPDHDPLAGLPAARRAAAGTPLEVIAGVEITAEHHGRELHLLGYFVDPDYPSLLEALAEICRGRA